MGFLDRIKQAVRGDGRAAQTGGAYTRDHAHPPQTTAFGTIDAHGQPAARPSRTEDDRTEDDRTEDDRTEDDHAVERYRYLLRTAPPETIEQVHAEAFAKLSDEQRQRILAELSGSLSPQERPASAGPAAMARAATRAEYQQPGTMERTLGSRQDPGLGTAIGGSLLGTVAGYVVGSALVSSFIGPSVAAGGDPGGADGGGGESADAGGFGDAGSATETSAGTEAPGDAGFGDFGGFGGDIGGFDV
ncbi:hypothetical protein QWJ90_07395 [Microbacterium oryzae]|uniref:hypothetical protein n=1 Tax=Microbacterium oryzae TaxID=743009 RepID=UPI0025AF0904|nr:hypothetical protein [Microbacterium oryzae]MDN3310751.1 hypothetical protein [Microbacterium oryzae]